MDETQTDSETGTDTGSGDAAPGVSASVVIARSPEDLYDMVADVTRMGEWSPACRGGRWDDGSGPQVGAWFTGTNVARDREYETRNEIVAADRPNEVAWVAGGAAEGWARWCYRFEAVDGGTLVSESWEPARMQTLVPDATPELITRMGDRFRGAIEQTLANLKAAAES